MKLETRTTTIDQQGMKLEQQLLANSEMKLEQQGMNLEPIDQKGMKSE